MTSDLDAFVTVSAVVDDGEGVLEPRASNPDDVGYQLAHSDNNLQAGGNTSSELDICKR